MSSLLRPVKQSISFPKEEPPQLGRVDRYGTEIIKGGKNHKLVFRDELDSVAKVVPTINVNLSGTPNPPAVPGPKTLNLGLCDVVEVESYKLFNQLNTQTVNERMSSRKELEYEEGSSFCALF